VLAVPAFDLPASEFGLDQVVLVAMLAGNWEIHVAPGEYELLRIIVTVR
jgi:hypothetical protein